MASGLPGWYPDPAGQAGLFRYWDGQAWSEQLSPTPYSPPPAGPGPAAPYTPADQKPSSTAAGSGGIGQPTQASAGAASGYAGTGQGYASGNPAAGPNYAAAPHGAAPGQTYGSTGGPNYGAGAPGTPYGPGGPNYGAGAPGTPYGPGGPGGPGNFPTLPKKKRNTGIWVGLGVLVVALGIIAWQVAIRIGGDPSIDDLPTSNPTSTTICPPQGEFFRGNHPNDGRVYGGQLSYPLLLPPWSAVQEDESRVPFGRDIAEQTIPVHLYYDGNQSWVASILIGELYAGDGFFTPEEGSQIVTQCIVRTFYGDAAVERNDLQNQAITLDGYDGWLVETTLSFDIPGLPTKSEWVVIVIVATSEMSSSIFYASIPEDSPDAAFAGAQAAWDGLRVEE
jgi:hypothetical protein